MKKNILSFVTLSVIIFSACAQQKKTTSTKATNTASATTKANTTNIEKLVMERTPCFGTCPAYRLELDKSGKVVYTSWSSTEYEGVYEKYFAANQVISLFQRFEEYRVDTCKQEYDNIIADVPGLNYYITYKKKEQVISNAHFGPDFLGVLGANVNEFAIVDSTWKKTAEAGQK